MHYDKDKYGLSDVLYDTQRNSNRLLLVEIHIFRSIFIMRNILSNLLL